MSYAGIFFGTIGVVACLTAAASAVRSVSRIWLRHWVERRLSGSQTAELFLDRPQRLLLAASTGVAITVFFAGTLIGSIVEGGVAARVQAIVMYAFALLLLGQLIPRAIARRWSSAIIPVLLPALRVVEFLLMPLLIVARKLTGEAKRERAEGSGTDAEALEELLREGELEGVGEHTEISIIEGVVQFGEKTLGDVMTPRADIFSLSLGTPPDEMARQIASSGYSRVPIHRGSLDDVAGMIHAIDVMQNEGSDAIEPRPVAFATPSMTCNDFLFRMIRERRHLAVVRNDHGNTVGIVTLEDLLEELVGDIRDEHDDPTPSPSLGAPPTPPPPQAR
ncbi:MAG: CNNM domain-containing protein [Gemmatimonadaceae bacterium]